MIELHTLAKFLDRTLNAEQFTDDFNGIYQPSTRPIQRIGLILEPLPELSDWIVSHQIDALFCHRPWNLQVAQLPTEMGVLAYHLSFDEALTIGYNPFLAKDLGMKKLLVLGKKLERPIGMIGEVVHQPLKDCIFQIEAMFGGMEVVISGLEQISRIAVVGAMSAELIQMAADCGAELYITGQLRRSAESALRATKISVIAVGHQRSEAWGLRMLARLLQQQFPSLEVVLLRDGTSEQTTS
jgi:putative NIF3 family GTP cyclohydrolase 1 type 2